MTSLTLVEKIPVGERSKLSLTIGGVISCVKKWNNLKKIDVYRTGFRKDLVDALNADSVISRRTDLKVVYSLR